MEARPYEYVSPGQAIMEVVGNQEWRLQFFIPSAWITKVKQKRRFFVVIDETKERLEAEVTHLGARIDPVSQTLEVWAGFVAPSTRIISGMSGTAHF